MNDMLGRPIKKDAWLARGTARTTLNISYVIDDEMRIRTYNPSSGEWGRPTKMQRTCATLIICPTSLPPEVQMAAEFVHD